MRDGGADEPASRGRRRHASIRVLVADDCPVNLMVISAQLEAKGLSPLLAENGTEAVALACASHFDLILMDLQMPVLGGLEAAAAIRRFECTGALPAVPIIAYTSTSPTPDVLSGHGMSGRLAKPCTEQDLEDCLLRWCPAYGSAPAEANTPREAGARPGSGHGRDGSRTWVGDGRA